ncbi:MAG TPA: hypothetical protein PKD12_05370 [Nitrospira sp.]|nr:hypothetical protein [Nitrospira sp.]
MIDVQKSAVFSLLMTLVILSSWQVAEAADAVHGRHSLIHRPQIQPAPAVRPAPSLPQPQLHSSTPSPPVHRKVLRRPAAPAPPLAEATPITPADSDQTDPSSTTHQPYNLDDAQPEAELASPPAPQEPPNAEAR